MSGPLLNPTKYCQDATDEIDSVLGFRYVTPFDLTALTTTHRPVALLIKRICVWLASGRLIMAIATQGEQNTLHAYGASLVKQAIDTLNGIVSGDIILDGVTTVDPGSAGPPTSVPLLFNQDAESAVEAFYDRVVNPNVPVL